MKKHPLIFVLIFASLLTFSCNKEKDSSFLNKPENDNYQTGSIRFQYYSINPGDTVKKQQVNFTTLYNLPEERWMCGFFWPERRWMGIVRTSADKQDVRASIFFPDINLDSLPIPFVFSADKKLNARMGYCLGYKEYYDSTGKFAGDYDVYSGETKHDFKITLLSKSNHHLKGIFSGTIKHKYRGYLMKIENGDFDVKYELR
ncbi:hypothetical protein [Pollutibacter soli]|uniref:hypothetical protein n=1 Tax=Pollutibacter soli TaxID=3034157 RepID=UPI003013F716